MKKPRSRARWNRPRASGPAAVNQPITIRRSLRFMAKDSTAETPTTITATDIIGACGAMCTTSNSIAHPIARSFRIHRVNMWSSTVGKPISIVWYDEESAEKSIGTMDIPVSTSHPAHISLPPPPAWREWVEPTGGSVFLIEGPQYTIVDLDLTYTLSNGSAGGTIAISTGVVGVLYFMPLDGSSDIWLPVGLVDTT